MARKRTKARAKKSVPRKKAVGAAKKPRKSAAKTSRPKPAVPGRAGASGGMDLLRGWSSSRYSTR